MKNNFLFGFIFLTLLSACKKKDDGQTTTDLTAYPSSIISTPIITTNIPVEVSDFQTPINIDTLNTVVFHSTDPILHYGTITLSSVINNEGENLKISIDSTDKINNYLTVGGKKYNLAQFHFHYTSEHTFNGVYSTMEIHFVNISSDNSYAVLGVLVDLGTGNNALQTLFDASPTDTNGVNSPNTSFTLSDLFPSNTGQYYTYSGSLTTPNYGANSSIPNGGPVTWIVYKNSQHVSSTQFDSYKSIYEEHNFRTIRPTNGRKVYKNPGN